MSKRRDNGGMAIVDATSSGAENVSVVISPPPAPLPSANPLDRARADHEANRKTPAAGLYATVHALRTKYPLLTVHEKAKVLRGAIEKLTAAENDALREWLAKVYEGRIGGA